MQKGLCRRCTQPNSYTLSTCSFCGERLTWASSFAENSGDKCPQCQTFNSYIHSNCQSCGEELPWSESPAARRYARAQEEGGPDSQFKAKAFTFLIALIAIGLFFGGILVVEMVLRGRSF